MVWVVTVAMVEMVEGMAVEAVSTAREKAVA